MSVRICPLCQATYPEDASVCPADGRTLWSVGDAEERLVGAVLDGRYTVQAPLGRGGIGLVFRAWQHGMERPVAVKVLRRGLLEDETSTRRFLREIQGAGRVSHPHVVTAFDHGQTPDGDLYLVMELLEGRTLAALLAAEGPLPTARAVALLAGMCDGLHAAHEAGVVHRDVKPENAIVLPDTGPTGEFIKVVDFGLAQLHTVAGAESITRTGQVCGTPAYMSPEQIHDQAVDRRTDVYALGVVAWLALAGRLPFQGETAMATLLGHLHQAAPPLAQYAPGVPVGVAAAVMAALAKDPAQRPATAAELKRLLQAGLSTPAAGPVDGGETVDRLPAFAPTLDSPLEPLPAVPVAAVGAPRRWWPAIVVALALAGGGAIWLAQAPSVAGVDAAPSVATRPADAGSAPPAVDAAPASAVDAAPALAVDAAPPPPDADPPPPADAAPASAATATLLVQTRPAGAAVYRGRERLGTTPLAVPRPAVDEVVTLQLRLPGHEARRLRITADQADPAPVTLRRLPAIVDQ
ncbi:MAG: serine/threonine protein kinase [Myxococcales bacterium]|nr:serine/threonine protein kinase [Myxococcales bacterium]